MVEDNIAFGNGHEGVKIVNGPNSANDPSFLPYGAVARRNCLGWNDGRRNRAQIGLPTAEFKPQSDGNFFVNAGVDPRMVLATTTLTTYLAGNLAAWRDVTGLDMTSTAVKAALPADTAAKLAARQLFAATDIPALLASACSR